MNAYLSMKLLRKYSKCEQCGNEKVGNGEGTVEIDDDIFKRTCKCGWKIELKESDIKK